MLPPRGIAANMCSQNTRRRADDGDIRRPDVDAEAEIGAFHTVLHESEEPGAMAGLEAVQRVQWVAADGLAAARWRQFQRQARA